MNVINTCITVLTKRPPKAREKHTRLQNIYVSSMLSDDFYKDKVEPCPTS